MRALLRIKGTPYEELGLGDASLTNEQLIDAMMAHPILIHRPIVVTPLGIRLCRPLEAVLDLLPQEQRGSFIKEDGQVVIDEHLVHRVFSSARPPEQPGHCRPGWQSGCGRKPECCFTQSVAGGLWRLDGARLCDIDRSNPHRSGCSQASAKLSHRCSTIAQAENSSGLL